MLGEVDRFLFNKGCHYELYNALGAHLREVDGVSGVHFAVWAPNARAVSLVCDSNHWQGTPMQSVESTGIWSLFVPGLKQGEKYKYEINGKQKCDPFAFYAEMRPNTASIVYDVKGARQPFTPKTGPLNIYEVHLGSWNAAKTYRDLAETLAKYAREMHYTHVELMPVMEHPLDESWGYQVTGFFAPTSRYGTPDDFAYFVDHLHENGIGVILDWVPAHFPMDDFALHRFDGTALYEHEDPRKGIHPHWNTAIFNYGRTEVSNFLIASALYWLSVFNVDGLRVDAVASMLYLDYGRQAGEWIANEDGSNYNVQAIEFLKHLTSIVHQRHPGKILIAEESSSFAGVTHKEGLGFDYKWNMGWMNDTLRYFSRDPIFRIYHQNDLTFGMLYAFHERFMNVLSHDEVVHGKGSLLAKMPGDDWQKFANLRLLYSYMMCMPGKKLSFMGLEIGQWNEWNALGTLEWDLLKYPLHNGLFTFVRDLNHFYLSNPPLYENDTSWEGFEWLSHSGTILSYYRKSKDKKLLCVHNLTPEYLEHHRFEGRELFNTDASEYGGSGKVNCGLAPLATIIYEV